MAGARSKETREQRPARDDEPNDRAPSRKVRFEATIFAGRKERRADWMNHLDIDLVPDPKKKVRALLTAEDCVRLLELGFEVRLHHAYPVRPLDPKLIESDESVRRWLDEGLRGIDRPLGQQRSPGSEDR